MKEKKMSKSVYDDFQERSEAIGSKGVSLKRELVGEGKSFLAKIWKNVLSKLWRSCAFYSAGWGARGRI